MNLYEVDYGLWLEDQIAKLKQHNWQELDVEHLIEELEALNKSNRRELYSYTVVLLVHLLKWQYQPVLRSGSWEGSIGNSRKRIERLLKDQPSLKPYLSEIVQEAYEEAKEWAHKETRLDINIFPSECPYSIQQMLNPDFLPK